MRAPPRRAQQQDENQKDIVAALEEIPGLSLEIIGHPCDLLIGYRNRNWLFEIKNPDAPNPRKTKKQKEFFDRWKGQVAEVWCLDQILATLNIGGG